MTASILSVCNTLFGVTKGKKYLAIFCVMSFFSFGLIFFLTSWQMMNSPVVKQEIIITPATKIPASFPDIRSEKDLMGLFGTSRQTSAIDGKERFRIGQSVDDDTLLLAAPRAKIRDSLVGILTSSNMEKNMVIIESAGKQTSYGLGDRIAGKFSVIRVFPDRVVINENGFYAALMLEAS